MYALAFKYLTRTSLVFTLAFIPTTVTLGLPSQETTVTYYADANMKTWAGLKLVATCGGVIKPPAVVGEKTEHSVTLHEPCEASPQAHPSIECRIDGVPTLCPRHICESKLFDCGD